MIVRLKIHSYNAVDEVLLALSKSGYKVWIEERYDDNDDWEYDQVCFEYPGVEHELNKEDINSEPPREVICPILRKEKDDSKKKYPKALRES